MQQSNLATLGQCPVYKWYFTSKTTIELRKEKYYIFYSQVKLYITLDILKS